MTDRSLTTGKEVGLFPRPYKFRFIYQLPPPPPAWQDTQSNSGLWLMSRKSVHGTNCMSAENEVKEEGEGNLHWNLTVWQGESLATLTLVGDGGWGGCCCTTSWRRVYPRWRSLSDVVTSTPPCCPPPDFQPDGTLQSPISSIHPELCTSARSLPYDQAAEKERMEEEKMSRRNSRNWNRRHEPGLAASCQLLPFYTVALIWVPKW